MLIFWDERVSDSKVSLSAYRKDIFGSQLIKRYTQTAEAEIREEEEASWAELSSSKLYEWEASEAFIKWRLLISWVCRRPV